VRYGLLLCELDQQLLLYDCQCLWNGGLGEDNVMNLYADHNYVIRKLAVLSTQGLVQAGTALSYM
jgi:hypothetical protein